MSTTEEVTELRKALRLDDSDPLLLPDPHPNLGEGQSFVCVRHKNTELAFIVRPEHFDNDECWTKCILQLRDCFKEMEDK